jgi:hypothetical protein
MAKLEKKARLREELDEFSERGAGLVELLEHLHASNRGLGRRDRLSDEEMDELSLHCWTLQRNEASGVLWGRARELWGGLGTGPAPSVARTRRRSRPSSRAA